MRIEQALNAIVSTIIDHCDPEEILLFGSHVRGSADKHSDVDLLVIGPFRQSRHLRGKDLRGVLEKLPIRVDLHLLTRAEMEAERNWRPRSFPHSVRSGAVTLFRRG